MHFRDARDYQIVFLSLFLVLGIGTKDWTLRPEMIGVAIATSILIQNLAATIEHYYLKKVRKVEKTLTFAWKSALITSLGLSLLLRTDHGITMALAATLAILSKFICQWRGKHFFNPANFGIITALVLTQDAWVSPGQWGDAGWYGLLFAGAGGLVLHRVGRWDTSVMFLGTYALCLSLRNFWLGWTWDVWYHSLSSGSLLLFALFMLTDPRSIPDARTARLLWSSTIALVTFILQTQFFLSSAIFWALFGLAPLTPLFDQMWQATRFTWESSGQQPDPIPCSTLIPAQNAEPESLNPAQS